MHLYFAVSSPHETREIADYCRDWPTEIPIGFLMSYHYFRRADLDNLMENLDVGGRRVLLFADSGAFSAMTQGSTVNIREYIDWLRRWKHLFVAYSSLDVIREAEASWYNQQIMEDQGLKPLPVFHVAEDWKWLDFYTSRYDYIALGVAGTRATKYFPWTVHCHRRVGNRVRLHGFGLTDARVMRSLPWHSVDSSSWNSGSKFGFALFWHPGRADFLKLPATDRKIMFENARTLRDWGYDPETILAMDTGRWRVMRSIGCRSMAEMAQWMTDYDGGTYAGKD